MPIAVCLGRCRARFAITGHSLFPDQIRECCIYRGNEHLSGYQSLPPFQILHPFQCRGVGGSCLW